MSDALVIGAGPAGSVTARELARRGCRVLLVDKAAFPRPKVCGCSLNAAAVGTLRKLGLGHVLAGGIPIGRVVVGHGRRSAVIPLPGAVALSRESFDTRLIEEAERHGVEFRPNTTVPMCSRDAKRSALASGSRLNGSPITVVASGLTGGDATPEPGSRIGGGVLIAARETPAFYAVGTIYMAVARGGYVGVLGVDGGKVDVAAAFDPGFVKSAGGLGPAAEAILGEVGWPVPPGLAGQPWKGTPALTRRPARLAEHRLFVVGDAAGYVEPFTGEGMAWAVMSAAALAPLAARAVHDWKPEFAREWEATHRRVIGRRQRVCRVVSRVLRSPLLTRVAVGTLSVFPALSRPVVAAINRHPAMPT